MPLLNATVLDVMEVRNHNFRFILIRRRKSGSKKIMKNYTDLYGFPRSHTLVQSDKEHSWDLYHLKFKEWLLFFVPEDMYGPRAGSDKKLQKKEVDKNSGQAVLWLLKLVLMEELTSAS